MNPLLKSFLFSLDPETAHNFVKQSACVLPLKSWSKKNRVRSPLLKVERDGLTFENPIGLAAGFDKTAESLKLIHALGFGFAELGSVSLMPCEGNTKPRIFRLLEDESLINWMGLPNPGIEDFLKNLKSNKTGLPVGINIVKTPDFAYDDLNEPIKDGIEDFVEAYTFAMNAGDYHCLNLSCPNSGDARLFEAPELFKKLASEIGLARAGARKHIPLYIKISPDLGEKDLEKTLNIADNAGFDGVVVSNTTNKREGLKSQLTDEQMSRGGLSGQALRKRSAGQLKRVRKILGPDKTLISVGGISTFDDVLSRLSAGAHMVQIYTGLIYGGTDLICKLNSKLKDYCASQGVKNYSELIGQKLLQKQ